MVELNKEVDEDDNVIGLRPKEDFHTGKYIHRSVHLILMNSREEIFLQKRRKDKKWYPGVYTFSVSATVAEETYEDCMKREMEEEIGIEVPFEKLFKYYYGDDCDKAWRMVFFATSDEKLTLEEREIESHVWITLSELLNDIEKNPEEYSPPLRKGIKLYTEYDKSN